MFSIIKKSVWWFGVFFGRVGMVCVSVVVCVVCGFGALVFWGWLPVSQPSRKDNIWQHQSCVRDSVVLPGLGFHLCGGEEEFQVNTKVREVMQKYCYCFCHKHVFSSTIWSLKHASVLFLSSPFKNNP